MTSISKNKNEQIILETLKIANSALKLKNLKLNLLLEITNAINNNFSRDQLLKIFEFVLRNQLNIGRLLFYTKDDEWECSIAHGLVPRVALPSIEHDLINIHEVQENTKNGAKYFEQFDVIIPIMHKNVPLAFLLAGDINEDLIENTKTRHIPFIQTLANIITVSIENKRLFKENIRRAGMKREMELASEMQNMLFPSKLPQNEHIEMAAYHKPHQDVGGDYYDYIQLSDNEVAFCMADVSGKGVSAALLMSNFQANLRALFKHEASLTDLVQELNSKVMSSAMGEKFITIFIAKYNFVTRVLQYVNAGQNPPLLISNDTTSQLSVGCPGLGMLDELPTIREGVVIIEPGSIITCYTDGVVELENMREREFGESKLELIILDNQNQPVRAINEKIVSLLRSHKGHMPYVDDIALLTTRFK
ncbi:MAG: PP2C family protein-serine/threonine phosphatase [Flavobacteriales bacterium]|nr:PP2C family protein-serine/threonine phosphatase [Flavobacteriales bacterium]MCB9204376.1 PP2C family protein-serine/threonine phosphatase [Flavobacteriales bacterium]